MCQFAARTYGFIVIFAVVIFITARGCKAQETCNATYPADQCHHHHCLTGPDYMILSCPEHHHILVNTSIVGFSNTYWAVHCPAGQLCESITNEPANLCDYKQSCQMYNNITHKDIGCYFPTNYIDIYFSCVNELTTSEPLSNITDATVTTQLSTSKNPISSGQTTISHMSSTTSIEKSSPSPSPPVTTEIEPPEITATTNRGGMTSRSTRIILTSIRPVHTSSEVGTTKIVSHTTTGNQFVSTSPTTKATTTKATEKPSSKTTDSHTPAPTTEGSPQTEPTDDDSDMNALSVGAIVGIAIGAAVLLALLIILLLVFCGKGKKTPPADDPVNMHFPHIVMPVKTDDFIENAFKPSAANKDLNRPISINIDKQRFDTLETVSTRISQQTGIRSVGQDDILQLLYSQPSTSDDV